ncbi:PAS domain S-box protein [bacterium]|nr:PAS domain S-box protein [bacterium]
MKQTKTEEDRGAQGWTDRMFALSPEPICLMRLDGVPEQVNPAFTQLLGYTSEDLARVMLLSLVHPDERAATLAIRDRLRAGEAVTGVTHRMRAKDGHYHRIEWSAWPDLEEGRVYVLGRNAQRLQQRADLQAHDIPLDTLIEALPDMVFLKDGRGRWVLANAQGLHLFRLDPGTYQGKTDLELGVQNPFFQEALEGCYLTDEEAWHARELRLAEETILQPDSPDRILETIKVPLFHPDGSRKGMLVVGRDVTERKRAQAERERLLVKEQKASSELEAARRLGDLKNNFVNAVSHDLRVPLTSIMGYAEFLADGLGGSLSETQEAYVQQIEQSARRLEALVNDLLDFARIDAGTFRLKSEEADLSLMIRESIECLHPQLEAARLGLELELPKAPLRAPMDPQRIEQVLINLLSNAIKFTPEGQSVRVRAQARDESLYCEVVDTGEGIAPEELPKLFARFSQLEGGIKKGGTGLGLNISKTIVEAHGGHIGVDSIPGEGSTFWFTLPLSPLKED